MSEPNLSFYSAKQLQENNRNLLVEMIRMELMAEEAERKKYISDLMAQDFIESETVLLLFDRIHKTRKHGKGGWGRAKRSAIMVWYKNLPRARDEINRYPALNNGLTHSDVCKYLHMSESLKDSEARTYYRELEHTGLHHTHFDPVKLEKPKQEEVENKEKSTFWQKLKGLLE